MAKILLVEDEGDLAHLVSGWLARSNHSIDVVGDGDEALSRIRAKRDFYELLILDVMLPGQMGWKFASFIVMSTAALQS